MILCPLVSGIYTLDPCIIFSLPKQGTNKQKEYVAVEVGENNASVHKAYYLWFRREREKLSRIFIFAFGGIMHAKNVCFYLYIWLLWKRKELIILFDDHFLLQIHFISVGTSREFSYRVTYTTTCHGGSVAVSSSFSPKLVNFKGCQLSWREQRLFSFLLFGRIKLNWITFQKSCQSWFIFLREFWVCKLCSCWCSLIIFFGGWVGEWQ